MGQGLTGCNEDIRGHIGNRPVIKKAASNGKLTAFFDISWGVNQPESNKLASWRHCIAYGDLAETIKGSSPGTYIRVYGWVATNPVYDKQGNKQYVNGSVVSSQYLIVESIFFLDKLELEAETVKQLCLVGS